MSQIIECKTNPNCKIVMDCDKKIDCTTAVEQNNGLVRYVCGVTPCEYLNKDLKMGNIDNELLIKLCEKLMANGICTFMQPLDDDISPYKNGYIIEIDFTKHDNKFKDQILKLEGKCKTWIDKANKLQDKCQELEEHISELEKKETEPINDSAPSMEWYENRHQSDCIEINRLNTTIDVLIHKIEHLRQFAGLE